jgi:GLPGLI family protein
MKFITTYFKLLVFILAFQGLNAQGFQGQAVYQSKTTVDFDFEGSNMTPDQIARIKQRMKSRLEQVYELDFTASESSFKQQEQLEAPTPNGGGRMRMFGSFMGETYKNIKEQRFAKERDISDKRFLIKDSLRVYNWQMTSETKTIGNYTVYKATAAVEIPPRPSFRFGRRGSDNSEEEKDSLPDPELPEIQIITAWYTLDIPVSNGPADYQGLPGLILEVSQGNTTMLCTKITINPADKIEIKEPKKGKEVSQEEFDVIMQQTMEQMRERMENNRQNGGNGNRIIIRG